MRFLQPEGWPEPKGYANGIEAEGRLVFVGGQIGWDAAGEFAAGLARRSGRRCATSWPYSPRREPARSTWSG